jgi:hypothetical protein
LFQFEISLGFDFVHDRGKTLMAPKSIRHPSGAWFACTRAPGLGPDLGGNTREYKHCLRASNTVDISSFFFFPAAPPRLLFFFESMTIPTCE